MESTPFPVPMLKMVDSQCNNLTTEIVYPFGNYKGDNYSQFMIAIHSPGQFYYTDIFSSFLLTVDEAWQLYSTLLNLQVDMETMVTPDQILSHIPDNLGSLEKQFKNYYTIAYKKVMENFQDYAYK